MPQTWNIETVEKNLDQLQYPSVGDEAGFSWRPCWTCQRPLGGNRVELNYIGDDGETYHEVICADCARYVANGDVPEE